MSGGSAESGVIGLDTRVKLTIGAEFVLLGMGEMQVL